MKILVIDTKRSRSTKTLVAGVRQRHQKVLFKEEFDFIFKIFQKEDKLDKYVDIYCQSTTVSYGRFDAALFDLICQPIPLILAD